MYIYITKQHGRRRLAENTTSEPRRVTAIIDGLEHNIPVAISTSDMTICMYPHVGFRIQTTYNIHDEKASFE